MLAATLQCADCHWQTTCSEAEILRRLRKLGLLRRAEHPPEELITELLAANASKLTCDGCGHTGLRVCDPIDDDGSDWQQAVVCEVCRQPIPLERVEVFPNAKRCVDCQAAADRGEEAEDPEFCERCGALVELRVSRGGGITRYKRFCTGDPPCRL